MKRSLEMPVVENARRGRTYGQDRIYRTPVGSAGDPKTHFCKLPPKVATYRGFKKFENERFMDSLKLTLNSQDDDYTKNRQLFFELCRNKLEHHAQRKKKYIRVNNKSFMTKALSKSIVEGTRLRNTFLKNPTVVNTLAYTKQTFVYHFSEK